MNIFVYLRILAFVAYVFLACYIFLKNPKSNLNRLVALFIGCFALWTLCVYLEWTTPVDRKDLWFMYQDISGLGWASFPSIFLLFTMHFTNKKKILTFKPVYLIFVGLPLIVIYALFNRQIFVDGIKTWYGWVPVWSDSIWTTFFNLYYLSFMAISLYLLIQFIFATSNKIRKKEAIIIVSTIGTTLFIGTITDAILPQTLNAETIPQFADVLAIIWAFGVVYAISKYDFLSISPATAAENLISIMGDAMILLDKDLKIIRVNNAVKKIFGYSSSFFKEKSINRVIHDKNFLKKIQSTSKIVDHEVILKNKSGKKISALVSASGIRDDLGDLAGFVLVIKDINELKKTQTKLQKNNEELKKINDVMVGREMKIIELKEENKKLKNNL